MMEEKRIKREKGSGSKRNQSRRKKEVEFTIFAPEVREVFLTGEFNSWNPETLPMKKDLQGVWRKKIKLPAGSHQYKFFIDGAWFEGYLTDEKLITNPFGTQNFIKEVV